VGLLGLVSANNVVIRINSEDDADTVQNNGITIHASIMATSNEDATFNVENSLLESVVFSKRIIERTNGNSIEIGEPKCLTTE
jgi:hypothetical protein